MYIEAIEGTVGQAAARQTLSDLPGSNIERGNIRCVPENANSRGMKTLNLLSDLQRFLL